jgi:ketosteroid isomerase-like protein
MTSGATVELGVYSMLPRMSAADRQEIEDILAAYIHFFDSGDIARYSRLMAEDARFAIKIGDAVLEQARGRPAIVTFFTGIYDSIRGTNAQPRHHCTSILITDAGPAHATAQVGMIYSEYNAAARTTTVKNVGLYDFRFVKSDGRWLICDWVMKYDGFGQ